MIPGSRHPLLLQLNTFPLDSSCIASWTSVSGSTLVDDTGNYNGTIYGSPSITNSIITLDAVNDYIKFSSVAYSSKIITISLRLELTSNINTGSTGFVLESTTNSNNSANTYGLAIGTYAGNGVVAHRRNVTSRSESTGINVYSVGTSKHILTEIDNANNTIKFWDSGGQLSTTVPVTGAAVDQNFGTYDLYMGSRGGSSFFLPAKIYPKTRIYNRALTAAERTILFNEA